MLITVFNPNHIDNYSKLSPLQECYKFVSTLETHNSEICIHNDA